MANKKIALVTIAMSGALMTLPSHPVLAGDIAEVTEWYNTDQIMTIIPGADADLAPKERSIRLVMLIGKTIRVQ